MSNFKKGKTLLASRFQLPDARLFFTKARLYSNCIVLKGWSTSGRYSRTILFSEIEDTQWWFGRTDINFAIYLTSGEDLLLHIKGAGNWKYTLDELMNRDQMPDRGTIPESKASPTPVPRHFAA